jgi:hypothetical protein
MWQLMLGVGFVLMIIGMYSDGRNPLTVLSTVIGKAEPTVVVIDTQPTEPSNAPTVQEIVATFTPFPTLTAFPTLTPFPTMTVPPTITPIPKKLVFYRKSLDDTRGCMSLQIRGVNVKNWTFAVKNTGLGGTFDGGGNARVCGLKWNRKLTFTVFNTRGSAVAGGIDVVARDKAIMIANWK